MEAYINFCLTVGNISREKKSLPNHQRWHAKWNMHTCICTFGADLYAQSVLINKISASELSWKFIKVALLVGYVLF